ncbi:hypothetical protein [Salana multivorans]
MTGQAGVAGRARTEAERRWPSTVPTAPSSAQLVLAWHDAVMAAGFVLGAQWGYDTYRADHGAEGIDRVAGAVAPVTPCSCSAQRARADRAEERLAAVREALARHPRVCDLHDEDDLITCGWRFAVADVQAALDGSTS